MRELLIKEDYNLQGVVAITVDEWKEKGFKEGHLPRIKKSIQLFNL